MILDRGIIKRKRLTRENIYGLGFASLPLFGVLIFGLIPMLLSLIVSISELNGYRLEQMHFLSAAKMFSNYAYVLTDPLFWDSVKNTLIYALALPFSLAVSVVISVLIEAMSVGKKIFRVIFFIPYVCSIVVLSQAWRVLLNYDYGIVNEFIELVSGRRVDWLGAPAGFMTAMIVMGVWQSVGYQIILITAGLGSVNRVYYEAASLDGASRAKQFFSITLPQLSPVLFFLLVTGMIGSLQEFTRLQSINFGGTGPDHSGLTMVFYVYNMGFNYTFSFGMGYASAAAWIVALFVIGLTVFNFKFVQRRVSYD